MKSKILFVALIGALVFFSLDRGALIRGIDKYLSDIVKLPVFVADEPLLAVATGTGKALEEIKFLQQLVNEE